MFNKTITSAVLSLTLFGLLSFSAGEKLQSTKTHIKFFSHTPVEDIEAHNYQALSNFNTGTGEVVFSVPMQGFTFEKALMQKHFNQANFLDTKKHPKSKFVGKIENLSAINFDVDGTYPATVGGKMTIKDVSQDITAKGTITVQGKQITIQSAFPIALADYGIAFEKGKPATNIAKEIAVDVAAEFLQP
jgi:polyisoprenoid-binding protein YceI